MAYAIGLDHGTNSVRAVLVRCADGVEVATSVRPYPGGEAGVLLDPRDPNLARQRPADHLLGVEATVREVLAIARDTEPGFDPGQVVGIGVDATGSSPIPVDAHNAALADQDRFRDDLAAQCWLWKDHTAHAEAARITELARAHEPARLARCGDTYSSEWWWSKLWRCRNTSPEVFDAAFSWVELADWVPAVLAGVTDPREVKRGICAAGHKAMFVAELGGLPPADFLARLDPALAELRPRLYAEAHDANTPAGTLGEAWAERLGLPVGIAIAIGAFDVHYGAIGSGVRDGVLVKAIGTSTCDCTVSSADLDPVPGICGIVPGAILPGHVGIEAGQSAVGDLFRWWVEVVCEGDEALHARLTAEAAALLPGESGLLALDWNNGNRTVLVDPRLTGLLLGQTLHTTRAEVYRALIEATAFGARTILERLAEHGVAIETVVCCGGIAEKNPFLMQVYADVTGRTMGLAASGQACALGAAVAASVVGGAHPDFATAQAAMTGRQDLAYAPDPAHRATYDALFERYTLLHDAFGGVRSVDVGAIMKDLLAIKDAQRAHRLAKDASEA